MVEKYKVKREYLFLAKLGHLQFTTDCMKMPCPADTAARRTFARIKKSRGTIVAIHVKDPRHKG
jgi:hypothetical protein